MVRWLAPLAVMLALGGCASQAPEPAAAEPVPAKSSSKPVTRSPGLSAEAQRALARHGIQPHDTSPLTLESRCTHVNEIGTATDLNLAVAEGAVSQFAADVTMKGHGRCHFALADFKQEARTPQVLLRHAKDAKCTVRMWREQREQVTIAFNSCEKSCGGRAFDYLWPILVESRSGQCF